MNSKNIPILILPKISDDLNAELPEAVAELILPNREVKNETRKTAFGSAI